MERKWNGKMRKIMKSAFGNEMEWKWNGDGNQMEDWYRIEC